MALYNLTCIIFFLSFLLNVSVVIQCDLSGWHATLLWPICAPLAHDLVIFHSFFSCENPPCCIKGQRDSPTSHSSQCSNQTMATGIEWAGASCVQLLHMRSLCGILTPPGGCLLSVFCAAMWVNEYVSQLSSSVGLHWKWGSALGQSHSGEEEKADQK